MGQSASLRTRNANSRLARSRCCDFARFGRYVHLVQATDLHIVDIAVDGCVGRHERMLADAPSVLRARPPLWRGFDQTFPSKDAVARSSSSRSVMISSENSLHAAIGVVDDEPLLRAEQLVGNDKRADGVVRRTLAGAMMTCASLSAGPAYFAGSSWASMHVRIAKAPAGAAPDRPSCRTPARKTGWPRELR